METIRLSVRQLVEFTLHEEDLSFSSPSFKAMADGTKAHQNRQSTYIPPWEKEVSLSLTLQEEEAVFVVSGRMDGYFPHPHCPIVDEIKLYSDEEPLAAPFPVHLAQGICYGHILCATQGFKEVTVQITYVNLLGETLYSFSQTYTKAVLEEEFFFYYHSFSLWEIEKVRHRKKRNETLSSLQFPYNKYRKGQREMSVQVYGAIKQKKRLFASLPTGTGKSAAVLFPALKALGQGLSKQIFYLTARNTGKQSPIDVITQLKKQNLTLRVLSLSSKESLCFNSPSLQCSHCPYALGFFTRLPSALQGFLNHFPWYEEDVLSICKAHQICPFECSLALSEIADVVICDYNYAFDPSVRIKRIFDNPKNITLLVDETHHLPDRAREMLSGTLHGPTLVTFRRDVGKALSRTHPLYKSLSSLIVYLRNLSSSPAFFSLPLEKDFLELCQNVYLMVQSLSPVDQQNLSPLFLEVLRALNSFLFASQQPIENYSLLLESHGKEGALTLYATNVRDYMETITQKFHGTVYFSATLIPLFPMGKLLGGQEEDGYFSLPSPFPKEHLLVLRKNIDTRYQARKTTLEEVAQTIVNTFYAKKGKYIAYFPSFAYLNLLYEHLLSHFPHLPYLVQKPAMTTKEREEFLSSFLEDQKPLLGLCVLGGIFSEGVDLPGSALIGAMVIGVGLPMINPKQEALKTTLGRSFGNGFAYAYQYPGMQKVLQAAGRVIRSEKDYGVVVLIDQRYFHPSYMALCPEHWIFDFTSLTDFWSQKPKLLL